MSRKTLDIVIEGDNRDAGKLFHITEMPASRAERWAARALVALMNANADIGGPGVGGVPGSIPEPSQGLAGLASAICRLGSLEWQQVQPLYDELLACVEYEVPDKPGVRLPLSPHNVDAYIEETSTLLRLRLEVVGLHVGFSGAAALSNLTSMTVKAGEAAGEIGITPSMKTSPA